jgi:predicted nucleic acid-binding protein
MMAGRGGPWSVVIDASVVVEYLVGSMYAEHATRVFRRLVDEPDGTLWAPDLVYPECASALRKLVALKRLTRAKARERVAALARLPLAIGSSQLLVVDAFELATALTAYDATYVALAQRLDVPLVTADAKLARWLASQRREVLALAEC